MMGLYFVLAISNIVSCRGVRLVCRKKNSHLNTYKNNEREPYLSAPKSFKMQNKNSCSGQYTES